MLENKKQEWILHVDGDAFFASCEVSRRPDLFGKAVVVGEERGIATALTYPAKKLGVKRGDPIWKIKKEFPEVIILSSHFELYRKFAHNLAEILREYVDELEIYSIDECFATLKGDTEDIQKKVLEIKNIVQKKIGITYSFGVSTTKTLSKVASKRNKPDGLCFLMNDEDITEALKTTKVGDIWGIGWATDRKLQRYKIKTAYEFITNDLRDALTDSFSKGVFQTRDELQGVKHFSVGTNNAQQKSIQSTRTFLNKTNDKKILRGELSRNIEVACSELREKGLVTNHIYIFFKPKIKGEKYIEKSIEFANFTNLDTTIMKSIEHLFDESFNLGSTVYKKSGVTMLNLQSAEDLPQDLFGTQENINIEESKVTSLIDSIRNKYGFGMIGLASSLEANHKRGLDYDRRHKTDTYISGLPFPFLGIIK